MRILAIDPGPATSGMVLYDGRSVLQSWKAATLDEVLAEVARDGVDLVACERVQSYGIAGSSLLQTAEVYGEIKRAAAHAGVRFVGMYRRDVLRTLKIRVRKGRDAAVRAEMIRRHGGSKRAAVGIKASPGPLYGVASHAWQALGLAVAVFGMEGK